MPAGEQSIGEREARLQHFAIEAAGAETLREDVVGLVRDRPCVADRYRAGRIEQRAQHQPTTPQGAIPFPDDDETHIVGSELRQLAGVQATQAPADEAHLLPVPFA
jgi:hypothetical protein